MALKKSWLRLAGLSLALLGAGCATQRGNEIRALTDKELHPFFARAKDPRTFWITVYPSERGPMFAGANRVHMEQARSLPFQPEQTPLLLFESAAKASMPLVKFDANRDDEYLALIDTSSRRNWIDFATAQKTGVIPLGPPAMPDLPAHVQDDIPGYASVLSSLRFDQLHVETALLYTRAGQGPLGPLSRREEKPYPQLVVGCDLLKAFQFVQLDYPNRRVIFSASAGYSPDANLLVATVPLREAQGGFAAQGMINGEAKTFLLDSAGDFEVAMADPPTNVLRQVSVGGLVFRQVEVVSSQDCGLGLLKYPRIGRRLLCRYRVTFAPAQRKVHFEKPGGVKAE